MSNNIQYSIVIPSFNEEGSVIILLEKIRSIFLSKVQASEFEIVFVDDGSTDNSYFLVENWMQNTKMQMTLIRFRTNRGKSYALNAGFKEALGKVILTLDADLQDEPKELFNLIKKLNEDYDLVSGWKRNRNDPLSKTIPSLLFNSFTAFISGVKLHDFNCGLKAYRSEVVKDLNLYGELHRYIPLLAVWRGFRVSEIQVKHHKRKFGKSKYGLERYMRGFLDLITVTFLNKYLKRPLHLFGSVGLIFLFIGILILIYFTSLWFLGIGIGFRPLFFLGILMIIAGLQSFFFGLLGDMIASSNKNDQSYFLVKKK